MGQVDKTTAEIQAVLDQQYDGDEAINVGWDDITNSLIGRRLSSVQGTVDYNWGENCIAFSPNGDIDNDNDCVNFNLQKPHGASATLPLKMHFHWEQPDATPREFTVRYRIQDNGVAKTTAWTEVVINTSINNVFTYTLGTLNQITKIEDVDWNAAGISATVQFRVTRSDSVGGAVNVTFVDGHVAKDQERGSRQEFVK